MCKKGIRNRLIAAGLLILAVALLSDRREEETEADWDSAVDQA